MSEERPVDTGRSCTVCGAGVAAFNDAMCCHCETMPWKLAPTPASCSPDVVDHLRRLLAGATGENELQVGRHMLIQGIEEAADALESMMRREDAMREDHWKRWPQGDAGDAIDFACDHCGPEEALAFLEDWRSDRASEWPGYMRWLSVQRDGVRAALEGTPVKEGN